MLFVDRQEALARLDRRLAGAELVRALFVPEAAARTGGMELGGAMVITTADLL